MEHRRTSGYHIPERGHAHIWNHQNHDPHMHLGMITENGYPPRSMDNTAVSRVNSMAYSNHVSRQNDYAASSLNLEVSSPGTANLGIMHNRYLDPSSSDSSFHSNRLQHVPSYYNQYNVGGASNTLTPVPNNGRSRYKRRNPAMPQVYDREYTNGYYHAGTTSNGYAPSDFMQPDHMIAPQSWPLDSDSTAHNYWSDNLMDAREGFQRSVRSRYNHTYHLEPHSVEAYSSSNIRPHFHSTNNIPALHVGWQHSYHPESVALQRRSFSSDLHRPYYERYHPPTGVSVTNASRETSGVHNYSLPPTDAMSLAIHRALPQGMQIGHNSFDQRPAPYEPASSRQSLGFAATTLEDAAALRVEDAPSFGHSQPRSSTGSSSEWNGRVRNSRGGFQLLYDADVYMGWLLEGTVVLDEVTYNELGISYDLHNDMRVDIDDMSYEELLALGDTIGSVSTGVPEDSISSCLTEMVHRSSDRRQHDQNEEKCAICLEEYCDEEKLGKLKCEHEFHASCIKEWLLIKNDCPMCKAPALSDAKKGKRVISS